jgi:diaminopimelate epimerase
MEKLYDARGNLYLVVDPQTIRNRGVALPASPDIAAATWRNWTAAAIDAFCRAQADASGKPYLSDGLLVGPFETTAPFNLLIVNTDGSLAERSGNGLTIFTTALSYLGLVSPGQPVSLHVHHLGGALRTDVELGEAGGQSGVWVTMGEAAFGPDAVRATRGSHAPGHFGNAACSSVPALSALDPRWTASQFVSVGNPHCVTFLADAADLPGNDDLHAEPLHASLTRIANARDAAGNSGRVSPAGINLQWAAVLGPNRIAARVFERGEGPTLSSGTSATAVAAAAMHLGLVTGPEIDVVMPGGTAPVTAVWHGDALRLKLFGVAAPVLSPR